MPADSKLRDLAIKLYKQGAPVIVLSYELGVSPTKLLRWLENDFNQLRKGAVEPRREDGIDRAQDRPTGPGDTPNQEL